MSKSFRIKILKKLGTGLRKIRLEKELETADVALHSDLSIKSIREIERGNNVSFVKYRKLIYFYDKKFEVLIKDR